MEKEYRTKPLQYFSHLFGHEGENSLLSYLKEEGLAMALSSGSDHEMSVFSSFTVDITLTKKGLENVNDVIAAVFKYAQRIRDVGPQQFVFDECQKIGNLKFEFLDKGNSTNYCVKLARNMPNFENDADMEHLIKSSYVYESFDQERIKQIGAMLADPANTIISLTSKSFKEEELNQHEPWYNIKFTSEKYNETLLQAMLKPTVKENGKKLDLPPENKLIPSKFDILPEQPEHSAQPVFASQWDNAELWFKKDDRFKKPKGNVGVKIYTNDLNFGTTPISRVFGEVWKGCFNEYMREFKYMADCAELSLEATLALDNLQFHWSGFSDTLPIYVKETFQRVVAMRSADLEKIFDQVKEQILQEMKNFYLNQTFRLAAAYFDTVIMDMSFERKELKALLETFTFEDFKRMNEKWLQSGRMVFFVHGNFNKQETIAFVDEARQILNLKPVSKDSLSSVRCIQLVGSHHRVDFELEDQTNENSVLMAYYQFGVEGNDPRSKLLNEICLQYLDEPTFNQLRTNEQLGYVVFSRHCSKRDVIGAWFLVQSPTKGCSHIKASLNKHLKNMLEAVSKLSDKEFDEQRNSVLTQYSEKDLNLNMEFTRHWVNELSTHKYVWDRQEKECALLKELTCKEFKQHFKNMFNPKTMRRVDMHWNSKPHKEQET